MKKMQYRLSIVMQYGHVFASRANWMLVNLFWQQVVVVDQNHCPELDPITSRQ